MLRLQAFCVAGMILFTLFTVIWTTAQGRFDGISLLGALFAAGCVITDLYIESKIDNGY